MNFVRPKRIVHSDEPKTRRVRRTKLQMIEARLLESTSKTNEDSLQQDKKEIEYKDKGSEVQTSESEDSKFITKWVCIQRYATDHQGRPSTKCFSYITGGDLYDTKEEAIKNKSQFTWDVVQITYKNPKLI